MMKSNHILIVVLTLFCSTSLWAFDLPQAPSGFTVPSTVVNNAGTYNACAVKNAGGGAAAEFYPDLYCCQRPPRTDCLRDRIVEIRSDSELIQNLYTRLFVRRYPDAVPPPTFVPPYLEGSGSYEPVSVEVYESRLDTYVTLFNNSIKNLDDLIKPK